MPHIVLVGLIAVLLWSLAGHRLARWGVPGPAVLLVLGAITAIWDFGAFASTIDSPASEKVVEMILAILLFVDAIEVQGGIFGGEGRVTARLVLIALPVSLVLAATASLLLLPETVPFVMVVIACVIMPTDFAPAAQILRVGHISARIRQIINVESGYNDGLVSPLFAMSLALAAGWSLILQAAPTGNIDESEIEQRAEQFLTAFGMAVPATALAVVIGLVVGGAVGFAVRAAHRRDIVGDAGIRYVMVLLPLIVYGIAVIPVIEANGFVAAFVAGLAYRIARTRGADPRTIAHGELVLVDEVGVLASGFVWFILGGAALIVFTVGWDWRVAALALLALTVLRIGPVLLALLRSSVPRGDRLLIGLLGPRGTASIVFGLLAYNTLPEDEGNLVLTVTVVTVVGSILLHGIALPLALRRRERAPARR